MIQAAAPTGVAATDTANIQAALATGNNVQLAAGTYSVNATLVLSTQGQCLQGVPNYLTKIGFTGTLTYGIKMTVALEAVRDLYISGPSTITYLAGVTCVCSAEQCSFRNIWTQGGYNGIGVGADTANDIAQTVLVDCCTWQPSNAGIIIGNGTAGNVLDTHIFGHTAANGQYGVYCAGSGYTWDGGDTLGNSVSDFFQDTPGANPIRVAGVRSEGSAAFWTTAGPSGAYAGVTLEDIHFEANHLQSNGRWILHQFGGVLNLLNMVIKNNGAVTPVVRINTTGALSVNAIGLAQGAAAASAFSVGGTVPTINVAGYLQMDSAGSIPAASSGVQSSSLAASGLTGATAGGRLAGGTVSGAPASGTFITGDAVVDRGGGIWVCTADGTPGTWFNVGSTGGTTLPNVQFFTAGGTWTKPSGAKTVFVTVLPGAGGAGSGASGTSGTVLCGGGGGAAGLPGQRQFIA